MYKYCKYGADLRFSGFETVARYFQLKEFEIMNLFCLTEGVRYRMPAEDIRKNIYGIDNKII
jgi:vacuolar-type H+-ATPase subunit C/Vma6